MLGCKKGKAPPHNSFHSHPASSLVPDRWHSTPWSRVTPCHAMSRQFPSGQSCFEVFNSSTYMCVPKLWQLAILKNLPLNMISHYSSLFRPLVTIMEICVTTDWGQRKPTWKVSTLPSWPLALARLRSVIMNHTSGWPQKSWMRFCNRDEGT